MTKSIIQNKFPDLFTELIKASNLKHNYQEADYSIISMGEFRGGMKPANTFNKYSHVYGPLSVNYDYSPTWKNDVFVRLDSKFLKSYNWVVNEN